MTWRHSFITGVAVVALVAGLQAQATTTKTKSKGAASFISTTMTGEVVLVDGNWLLVKMQGSGQYRTFVVPASQQFMIDGQTRHVADLKPGTILTATVMTKKQSVTVRTTSVANGTVWYASGNYVILTLANGENREFNVPESYRFVVEGKPASVHELKKGMKVSAEKIVAEPQTEISTKTVVTGKGPK